MGQIIVSSGTFRMATIDGGAAIWSSALDLSPFAGAKIDVADVSGNHAISWGHGPDGILAYGPDLIPNGDMETGNPPTGWTGNAGATPAQSADANSGSFSLQMTRGTNDTVCASVSPSSFTVGKLYRLRAAIKLGTASQANVLMRTFGAPDNYLKDNPLNMHSPGSWTSYTQYGTILPGTTGLSIYLYLLSSSAGQTCLFDDISFDEVTALGVDALQLRNQAEESGSSRNLFSIDPGFNAQSIVTVTITTYPSFSNYLPPDSVTRAIGDSASMRLMVDVADASGLDVDVDFYDSGDNLIGSDTVTGGNGTAEYLWGSRAVDTAYGWYPKANTGDPDEVTGDTKTFTTRSTAVTIYPYKTGTARQAIIDAWAIAGPDVLGADYHTVQAAIDDGCLFLCVPKNMAHTETSTGVGLTIMSGMILFGESPVKAERPSIQVINNTPSGVELYAIQINDGGGGGNGQVFDIAGGLTSTHSLAGVNAAIFHVTNDSATGERFVGCTNNDIVLSNVVGSPIYVYVFLNDGPGGLALCAFDHSKTFSSIGTAILIGCGAGSIAGAWIYNCVFNDLPVNFLNNGANDIIVKNCCAQGALAPDNFYELSTGGFTRTTCADEQGLTFAADGYTLTEEDNNGTSLKNDLVFSFSDDIFGQTFMIWERAANEPPGGDISRRGIMNLGISLRSNWR